MVFLMLFLRNKFLGCKTLAFFAVLSSVAALTGCGEPFTYSYLIEHPAVLKKELDNCQLTNINTPAQSARCEVVLYAAATLASLINEMQADPEKFGQKILDQEMACAKIKTTRQALQQQLAALHAKKVPATDMTTVQSQLEQTEKMYQEQREKIKALLAVAGMGSPG